MNTGTRVSKQCVIFRVLIDSTGLLWVKFNRLIGQGIKLGSKLGECSKWSVTRLPVKDSDVPTVHKVM